MVSLSSGYRTLGLTTTASVSQFKAGWVAEMSDGINWGNVEPWGKKAVTFPGPDGKPGVWAIVEHASTDEVYYSKAMFKELGIAVPARGHAPVPPVLERIPQHPVDFSPGVERKRAPRGAAAGLVGLDRAHADDVLRRRGSASRPRSP